LRSAVTFVRFAPADSSCSHSQRGRRSWFFTGFYTDPILEIRGVRFETT
jgi:hypothetical protein